jgi:hypothetical protein
LETIVESGGFIDICYGARQNTDTSDLGLVGDANTTYGVLDSGYLACASCAVVVVGIFGSGKRLMVIKVV